MNDYSCRRVLAKFLLSETSLKTLPSTTPSGCQLHSERAHLLLQKCRGQLLLAVDFQSRFCSEVSVLAPTTLSARKALLVVASSARAGRRHRGSVWWIFSQDSFFSHRPSFACVCSSSACNACTAPASIRCVLRLFGLCRLKWSGPPACNGSPLPASGYLFFFFRSRSFLLFQLNACRRTLKQARGCTRQTLSFGRSRREASSSPQTLAPRG